VFRGHATDGHLAERQVLGVEARLGQVPAMAAIVLVTIPVMARAFRSKSISMRTWRRS